MATTVCEGPGDQPRNCCATFTDFERGVRYAGNMCSCGDGPQVSPADAALAEIERGIDGLRGCASAGLPKGSTRVLLRSALTLRNQLDSAITELVGCLDQAIQAHHDGDPTTSCAAWLSDQLKLASGAAHSQVRLARQLRALPDTAAAFASGALSAQHATAVARTVDRVVLGGGQGQVAESMLLVEARTRSPYDLLMWGRHLRHRLNPAELADEEEQEHEKRWLNLSRRCDGSYDLEGHYDAEDGTMLKVAIDGVLGPRARDDRRSPAQRRADGLSEITRRCLDSGQLPVRGGQRPHITITATLETLRGDPGSPAAELAWGFPISGEALRRIACDAELTPILLSRNGDPLHVGRTKRTATPRLRRALAERDRHCVWPGCDRPPDWCAGHHQQLWVRGGSTDIDQMALLCSVHHRKAHRGYRLERMPDGRLEVVPPSPGGPGFGPAIHSPPPPAA